MTLTAIQKLSLFQRLLGLTLKDMAEKTGYSTSAINNLKKGNIRYMRSHYIKIVEDEPKLEKYFTTELTKEEAVNELMDFILVDDTIDTKRIIGDVPAI